MWGRVVDWLDPAALVIRYHPRRALRLRGPVPLSRHPAIRDFLAHDLSLTHSLRVRGIRQQPGNHWKLVLKGPLNPWQRQRLRNFLLEELR